MYSRKLYDNKHRRSCRSVPAEHSGERLTHSEIHLVGTLPEEKCWNVPLSAVVLSRHVEILAREDTALFITLLGNEKQTFLLLDLKITVLLLDKMPPICKGFLCNRF